MAKKAELQIANFICKFGNRNLLDFARNIVMPAFLDTRLRRKYSNNDYFLHQTKLKIIRTENDTLYTIVGRIINNTTVKRHQIFTDKGLVPDEASLQSSPSALFMLILNNHRLLYVKETAFAPELKTFGLTLLKFIKIKRMQLINATALLKTRDKNGKIITKKRLQNIYPIPRLDVIPLSTEQTFSNFINRYDKLMSVKVRLINPNDEFDCDDLFTSLRDLKEDVDADLTVLENKNNKEGLDKKAVKLRYANLSEIGNYELTLNGTDKSGSRLIGNHEDFNVKVPLGDDIPKEIDDASEKLKVEYESLKQQNIIKFPKTLQKTKTLLKRLFTHLAL